MSKIKLIVAALTACLISLVVVALLVTGDKSGTANKITEIPGCHLSSLEQFPNEGEVAWYQVGYKTVIDGEVDLQNIDTWIPNESDKFLYREIEKTWPLVQSNEWTQSFRMTQVEGPLTYNLEIKPSGEFSIIVH